jgi:hypothetical protein
MGGKGGGVPKHITEKNTFSEKRVSNYGRLTVSQVRKIWIWEPYFSQPDKISQRKISYETLSISGFLSRNNGSVQRLDYGSNNLKREDKHRFSHLSHVNAMLSTGHQHSLCWVSLLWVSNLYCDSKTGREGLYSVVHSGSKTFWYWSRSEGPYQKLRIRILYFSSVPRFQEVNKKITFSQDFVLFSYTRYRYRYGTGTINVHRSLKITSHERFTEQ